MAKNNEKHLLYNLFNPRGNGKGVSKDEAKMPKNIRNFFPSYSRHFNLMFALNLYAFLGNFPILFALYALTGNLNVTGTAPSSPIFAPLYGAMQLGGTNPATAAVYGIHGIETAVSRPTTATMIFFYISILVIFTFGFVNLSTAYLMRNVVRGESISFFSDIWYSIKRNFRQGLILGILDLLFLVVIAYDLFFFSVNGAGVGGFLFAVMTVIAIIYWMMRYYMYQLLVTFDLSIGKIIKNSFIFAMIGFKRNIVAFLGTVIIAILDYMLFSTFMPLGIIFPVLVLVSLTKYMGIYAAYPKIKEVMIDPYYISDEVGAAKRGEEPDEGEKDAPIFIDRG